MRRCDTYFYSPSSPADFRGATRFLLLFLVFISCHAMAIAQSFLHATGAKILNVNNQEVLLNGVNLGGWALQEGYIIKPGWAGINGKQTQGTVKQTLYNAGMTDAAVETFYQNYRDNFITKPDIDYLAARGFNCVRLPLHYDLFLTPAQRAVRNGVLRGTTTYDSYVGALTDWYNGNQLFVDPANLEAFRMIDNTLAWCAANNMYVILDLHAAPGSQGTDVNIADALQPLDLWNRTVYRDITVRLWEAVAARYKNDARVAMYDLINEPNNVPSNPPIHDLLQRLITAVRAQGDNHLLLIEGNGYGNDFNYLEPFTFANAPNLVYNSHRYSGTGYLMDNNVTSTESGPNSLRFIGNLQNFRTKYSVPIWVGETGENTAGWMHGAATSLNSVGIGWCHWTYKRFGAGPNAALMHIVPPFIVDGPANLPQVLENIKFANCIPNPDVVNAIAPNQNSFVNYPGGGNYNGTTGAAAPVGSTVWLRGANSKYVSGENGARDMTCIRTDYGAWEAFLVTATSGSRVALQSQGKYVSSENGMGPMTCGRPSISGGEVFDWLGNADGTVSLRGTNGKYVSSGDGIQPMTCTSATVSSTEIFGFGLVPAGTVLAGRFASAASTGFYPNPVASHLTYQLPAGGQAHRLTVLDTAGRQVFNRTYGNTGAQNTVDLSGLKSGFYLVHLSGPALDTSFKISKQ